VRFRREGEGKRGVRFRGRKEKGELRKKKQEGVQGKDSRIPEEELSKDGQEGRGEDWQ